MSNQTLTATWSHVVPTLRTRLQEIPASRRPGFEPALIVCVYLADKQTDRRGWANESVDQICDATDLRKATVKNVLRALDDLAIWASMGKGNQHSPTKRTPEFVPEQSEADLANLPPEQRQVDLAKLPVDNETAKTGRPSQAPCGQEPSMARWDPEHGYLDLATPPSLPPNTAAAAADESDPVTAALDVVIERRQLVEISTTKDFPGRWLASARLNIGGQLASMATVDPTLTAQQLADNHTPPPHKPADTRPTSGPRQNLHAGCHHCDGYGFIAHPDGTSICHHQVA